MDDVNEPVNEEGDERFKPHFEEMDKQAFRELYADIVSAPMLGKEDYAGLDEDELVERLRLEHFEMDSAIAKGLADFDAGNYVTGIEAARKELKKRMGSKG